MRRVLLYVLLTNCFFCNSIYSQDPHLSQNEVFTNYSNAASTGIIDTDFKLSGSYRSQWSTIPDGYKTYLVSFEQKLKAFSYGLDILSNNAGEASLHQNSLRIKVAYGKVLSNKNTLRAGAAIGIIQQRFNPVSFQFDNQYEAGVGYNSSLGSQETFDKTSQVIPDFSAGIMYLATLGKLENEMGISMLHLNQPSASFYSNGEAVYPVRTFLHLKTKYPLREKMAPYGQAQYSKQATAKKVIIGGGMDYKIHGDKIWNLNLSSRLKDAIIFGTGIKLNKSAFAINYELHRSKLSNATHGRGAIELSVTLYFNKNKVADEILNKENTNQALTDRDNDQIPDNMDECPDIPGTWQHNGCNDKDSDGVYDSIDACPNLFGHKLNKGCPMDELIDSDLDGLIDEVDECPFLKGLPEHKGCPDTDKDGVSDKLDNCPFLSGSTNNNGCPNRSISEINNFSTDFPPKVHVLFDTDDFEVRAAYFKKLNEMVEYLISIPESKIFISGHTDDEGDALYNYALGERRSNEVMNYFIERGISVSRMSIISYGEMKPIHKNSNVYSKAKNRRVEVVVIQ